jgi:7-cyano-7-deazaguanine synthase in queuosine biosynthesis
MLGVKYDMRWQCYSAKIERHKPLDAANAMCGNCRFCEQYCRKLQNYWTVINI